MCARKQRRLRVLDAAEQDLDEIVLYSLKRWGTVQSRRYLSDLRRTMNSLRDFPELGPKRDDVYPGCRILAVEQHIVYYRIADDEIVVGRVLHASQDPVGKVVL